jgi:RNA polymerase sigma-70 factor (ECF subfamily)
MAKLTVISGGKSDARGFEHLIRPHFDVLYRVAYRLTRSVPDAEDLVQEVCVRAYPRLEELATLDKPGAWLLRVMQRIFIDERRRYERKHVDSLDEIGIDSLMSDAPGPAELGEKMQRDRKLELEWRQLSRQERSLLALHDVEGYSLAELVEITGVKEGTLKSRLHRARIKLGKLLLRGETASAGQTDAGEAR